jgi:hypothetical protein
VGESDFEFLLGFPAFVLLWVLSLNLLALWGGWRSLALSNKSTAPPNGERFWFRSASLGSVNYGGNLIFTTSPAGLHLAVFPLFRLGHAPLFFPWSEVAAQAHRGWVFRYVDFRFSRQPQVRLRVSRGLAEKLLGRFGQAVRLHEAA